MKINHIDCYKLPVTGYVIAYTTECALYAPYKVEKDKIVIDLKYEDMLTKAYECHFFDMHKEYRLIYREARDDEIELVVTDKEEEEMNPDLIYIEDVLILPSYLGDKNLPDKLRIINRYKYSDNDTLVLDNYRIGLVSE